MTKHFKSFRRLASVIGMLVLVTATLAGLPAPKALAAGCHFFNYSIRGGYTEGGSLVNYTDHFTVPYTSTCHDINLNSMYDQDPNVGWICANVRVRFFPSSGGSYANSWKWYCPSHTMVIASDVKDGTSYRLEFQTSHLVLGQVFD